MPTHPSSDTGQDGPPTRTRMPEGHGGHGAAPRRTKPSRALVTVLGVVVLLVAVIVLANRGGGNTASDGASSGGTKGTNANPTAPTGDKPVTGNNAGIAAGFAKSEQGAQSAAANYAVALGGDGMFNTDRRHAIIDAIADRSTVGTMQAGFDTNYSKAFLAGIGLSADGAAPAGLTFVDRTIPAGTKIDKFDGDTANVSVWCAGMFGLAGNASTKPVTNNWFTVTFTLKWNGSDWKVLDTGQKKGPTPVSGDNPVSGAGEIADAVKGFGGFTYAR
ncbi:hypothetical protein G3I60_21925 [Streptomyces sp. SID13666]|uniref:hypothetical protein n=1 Tax=Streptomyces TaxID=1883 RepID=UPI0011070F84|nr:MULTISPECIES: hypothetical protein [Streptomyces]MCZ4099420.1 hypothetical protein [Streptomyces sp. H39-C1]NEA56724.1 hypothetical protein [Streptomyces sp. SID13666]NEA73168.1 hypothetical protein [Streptomyces sp. SID13588]QNA74529.1 hypothetical protein C8250_023885 [Streptomyces sp. So13.3]